MVSEQLSSRPMPAELSEPQGTEGSYVDWAAILAGGVFALAISFLLNSFGASLGLSLSSPYGSEGVSASWLAIAAGIWFAWVLPPDRRFPMTRRTQAEVFIQTLEEMRDEERERKKARLRLQIKAHVKRFVEEFRSDLHRGRHAPEWSPEGRRSADQAVRRFRED